jgi:hypothetical protein
MIERRFTGQKRMADMRKKINQLNKWAAEELAAGFEDRAKKHAACAKRMQSRLELAQN